MRRVVVWLPVLLIVAVLAIFGLRLAAGEPIQTSPLLNGPAPDFTLTDLDSGQAVTLSEHRGALVVLNFWASWCPPCRDEHPALVAAANTFPEVRFVGVTHQDDPVASRTFLDDYGRSDHARYVEDPGSRIGIQYGIFGLPETFLIDESGVVVGKITGPATLGTLLATIEQMQAGERPGLIVAGEVQAVPGS